MRAPKQGATPSTLGGAVDSNTAMERGVEDLITDHLAANLEVLTENDMVRMWRPCLGQYCLPLYWHLPPPLALHYCVLVSVLLAAQHT